MDGILLVDKPAGWTSHDVVAKVRSIIKAGSGQEVKIGHTGTLDPFATGLLILVVGNYTKRAAEFSKLDKIYEAELALGAVSTTGDTEGQITTKNVHMGKKRGSRDEIKKVLQSFVGQIEQTPHRYSAVKVKGQRAYKLARQGKEVKLEPRQVTVKRLQVTEYKYPKLKIIAKVSSGTYIRSLAEDIGQALGAGAYLSALRRTQIGQFPVEDATMIDGLDLATINTKIMRDY